MSPRTHDGAPGAVDNGMDAESIDTGEPVAELANLTAEAPRGFLGRLWSRIDRRRLGGDVADFGWHGLFAVVSEFLSMAMEIFKTRGEAESTPGDRGETT